MTRIVILGLCATLLSLPALAQNPQAPRGEGSATAPNAQGMMTDPGPRPPSHPGAQRRAGVGQHQSERDAAAGRTLWDPAGGHGTVAAAPPGQLITPAAYSAHQHTTACNGIRAQYTQIGASNPAI